MTYIVSSGALNSTHSLTHSEGIIKSRDTTGISDREYREYRDITQERIVYHDILKNVDRPMSTKKCHNEIHNSILFTTNPNN